MKIVFAIIVLLVSASNIYAADFHVSISGSDTSGDGSIDKPWRTPEFGAKQLSPGDTLIIHSGVYLLSANNLPENQNAINRARAMVSPPIAVDGTPEKPFTIRSAGDGEVFLDAGENPEWPAIGTSEGDYVIIDGFKIRGAAILWDTKGSIIRNSDLFGGLDTPYKNGGDNFGVVLRVENCYECLIQNNNLHDNTERDGIHSDALMVEYDTYDTIIEGNNFFNGMGAGLFLKDNPESVHVRNNYFFDNGWSGVESANQDDGHNVYIYNNLFRNNNTKRDDGRGAITFLIEVTHFEVYNNTFYNNNVADLRMRFDSANDIYLWNNLHSKSEAYIKAGYSSSGASIESVLTYSDYNQFENDFLSRSNNDTYNTISDLKTLGYELNSTVSSPQFVNPGGIKAEDYKRVDYPPNGRGGDYAQVIGAYISETGSIGFIKPKSPTIIKVE